MRQETRVVFEIILNIVVCGRKQVVFEIILNTVVCGRQQVVFEMNLNTGVWQETSCFLNEVEHWCVAGNQLFLK